PRPSSRPFLEAIDVHGTVGISNHALGRGCALQPEHGRRSTANTQRSKVDGIGLGHGQRPTVVACKRLLRLDESGVWAITPAFGNGSPKLGLSAPTPNPLPSHA